MKIIQFLPATLILFLVQNFQEVFPQFSVIKSDTSHFPQPDPNIARHLSKNCSPIDYINKTVSAYWDDFFMYETPGNGSKPFRKFLSTPEATRDALNKLCYFDNDNHGYLYECGQGDIALCQCMKDPIMTLAVITNSKTGLVSCLVDENKTCIAKQRTKPNPSSPKEPIPVPYTCIPDHYCDLKAEKCLPCYDPDPEKNKGKKKPDPICPDPPEHNNSVGGLLGSSIFLGWGVMTYIWLYCYN